MNEILEKYGYCPDSQAISRNLEILASNITDVISSNLLKECFGMMDLTSLKNNDTPSGIRKLVEKVDAFKEMYPDYPNPASICVFSNFAKVIKDCKKSDDVNITVVSAVFPHAQSFIDVKVLEVAMAVEAGADEVDIVMPLNAFFDNDYATVADEIRRVRQTLDNSGRKIILKVILETGLLVTPEAIATASFIAMESGADFIKTSTGKTDVSATPTAAYIMCECIAAYYKATGKMVGFKPAGGMTTSRDAVCYYYIVNAVLGKQWLNKNYFRLGVSRMANNLLSDLEQRTVSYF